MDIISSICLWDPQRGVKPRTLWPNCCPKQLLIRYLRGNVTLFVVVVKSTIPLAVSLMVLEVTYVMGGGAVITEGDSKQNCLTVLCRVFNVSVTRRRI